MSPFAAHYGYYPFTSTSPIERNILSRSSGAYGHWMIAVDKHCKTELENTSKRLKKYTVQTCNQPRSLEIRSLVKFNRKNIKTRGAARKLKHKMYGSFEIVDIILPMPVGLCLPKSWKIHQVFHISIVEPFVKGNRDVNLNAVINTSDPIESPPDYDIDKVTCSVEKDGKISYLVK
jgi:hypothetical protein